MRLASDVTDWLYTARERFTPANTGRWADYVAWIGFTHIEELVTLDHILCAELIDELTDADWLHNVHADFRIKWFRDVDYLRQRFPWRIGRDQILAMIEKPIAEYPPPPGFTACGFDIVDGYDSISVLTNCGRFPGIIDPTAINNWGLLSSLATANAIAERIRTEFPEEPHCSACRVWQVARDAGPGK
jgi:hypothetical protein